VKENQIRIVFDTDEDAAGSAAEQAQDALGNLGALLGEMAGKIKKAFAAVGSAMKVAMRQTKTAVTGTGKAVKRTVAAFDQLNRLKEPTVVGKTAEQKRLEEMQQKVENFAAALKKISQETVPESVGKLVDSLGQISGWFTREEPQMNGFLGRLQSIAQAMGLAGDGSQAFGLALSLLGGPAETVRQGLGALKDLLPVLRAGWDTAGIGATDAFAKMQGVWSNTSSWVQGQVITPISGAFQGLWSKLVQGNTQSSADMQTALDVLAQHIATRFAGIWQTVKQAFTPGGQAFEGIGEGTLSQFKAMVNGLIDGINDVVTIPFNGLNKALASINQLEILGIKPFKWLSWRAPIPKLPQLAQGAVLPANKPFLAVVGDQKHGTNVEAPLSTIQEAVALVMEEQLQAMMAGFQALLEEQRATRRTIAEIEVGDTVIGQAAMRYQHRVATMQGG